MRLRTDPCGIRRGLCIAASLGKVLLLDFVFYREMGSGMLCLCKKVFWIQNGFLLFIYTPVPQKEADLLLRYVSSSRKQQPTTHKKTNVLTLVLPRGYIGCVVSPFVAGDSLSPENQKVN